MLSQSSHKSQFALDSAIVGIWEWDYEVNHLDWDYNMFKLYDADPDKFEGAYEAWSKRVHPDDINEQAKLLDIAIKENVPFDTEFRIVDSNGNVKHIVAKAKHYFDENKKRNVMLGTNWDITQVRENDQAIKESNLRFEQIFDNSPIGKAIVSLEGKWLDVNHSLSSFLGYSKEEFLKLSFQDITYPDDLDADLELVRKTISGEIDKYSIEKRYIKKDGSIVWALLNVTLVHDSDKKPLYFISQITDIDKEKKLRDNLKSKNEELEQLTNEIKLKMEQLEEFSRIVAHNLKGPASNITNTLSFIKNGYIENDEALDLIEISSKSLSMTLNNLNEILKVRLKEDIPLKAISINEIIEVNKKVLHTQIAEVNPIFNINLKVKTLNYFYPYLESIFYNLLSNSLKYYSKDRRLEISIDTYKNDDKVILEYRDNGIGIDMEAHGKKLFEFNRVIHKYYEGTGIGMYITKTQIERLGGTIVPYSEPNKGLKFIISFTGN
jgi:PAS domain S-box-containing protein